MYAIPFLDLPALAQIRGTVVLPGSKSISNRVLLLAALCEGTTVVHDALDSDDTRVMLAALQQLGVGVQVNGTTVAITGCGGRFAPSSAAPAELFLGNAGTAMRPLAAVLAVLGVPATLSGVARMHERPIGDLVDALRQFGCTVDYLGETGYPPIRVDQITENRQYSISVKGNVSSQFLTALLMALPLAVPSPDDQPIELRVEGELISKPYIEITLNLLARFGVIVRRDGWSRFTIQPGSRYRAPEHVYVEADASSASYFIAAGALACEGRGEDDCVRIKGVGADSIQGDIRFVDAARAMGADIRSGANWLEIRRGAWPLKAIDLDCNHIPDAAMTLAVMALYAEGTTVLRNIASWRVKETDRLSAMATELRKLGATVEEGGDFIAITPPRELGVWRAATIGTYDDHRMAMCFSLAAFNPAGLPVRILDPKCVAKTFPDYFEALLALARPRGEVPVICIDGPSASGKGTLASELAKRLGYHYLDSGALYRVTALAATRAGLSLDAEHEANIVRLIQTLNPRFDDGRIWLNGEDCGTAIRADDMGGKASQVSALPGVRAALLDLQRRAARLPGLVADGRDMGTVIFPQAPLKVFLTATPETRADRRHKQLMANGFDAKLSDLLADLQARDARDTQRSVAPLKPAEDAKPLDNSQLGIEESVQQVLSWWLALQPFAAT
ncbi:cytidylate kinase [Comamonas serinivorans]|uniref:Multifunctional fusion protein n=1 Tax=Comamonas serinivorans TaxID=1082851 RepID=A0A1Y0ERE5_9BURK|nr:bifunctional 3-phosphoshikimate 1-carboxyvinyltransferase/cytidylate kinase [Comamonas serinivorans]ARU06183.1 cytidylate kinase [Comamonas serinivorans]